MIRTSNNGVAQDTKNGTTNPIGFDLWKSSTTVAGLRWLDYDRFCNKLVVNAIPGSNLEVARVAYLVASVNLPKTETPEA